MGVFAVFKGVLACFMLRFRALIALLSDKVIQSSRITTAVILLFFLANLRVGSVKDLCLRN